MPPKKGFKATEESKKINSEAKKGSKNPMFGKYHTDEWKQMMSKVQKGRLKSAETIQRMKEAHKDDPGRPKGYKHTQETKDKVSKSRKGMKFSEEHRKHLSEAHKGQIVTEEGKIKRSKYNKAHPEVNERLRKMRMKRPSKPQLELFNIITKLYPDYKVEQEWKVETKEGRKLIDVAIPELLLGFEFDGKYWHRNSKERDITRHLLIENEGWKLTHYSDVPEFPKNKKGNDFRGYFGN